MSETSSLLRVEGLNAGYGAIQVLWDINLEVKTAEVVCIIGANGAGKSTLMGNLIGVYRPQSGKIIYQGNDITPLDSRQRVRRGLALVPEGRQLFYGMSVEDNLLIGASSRTDAEAIGWDLDSIFDIFKPLKPYRKSLAGNLSGGEQQMCAIGRALMSQPRLLMVDELSLGLAPVIVDLLVELLVRIKEEKNITALMVEQDVEIALQISDRGYVLEAGRIVLSDRSDLLSENVHIKEAYIGA